ncbi:MAG: UpxY family transcription antiterminator [Syntrophales bacterium]|nr:UpxY family transcription antiterminator [Syntrophales bacterium]
MPGARSTSLEKDADPGIPWYVIHTCCHHEGRVEERLRQKGLEVFLPRCLRASRRRDRKKLLQVPLFPGYLFVQDLLENFTYRDIIRLPGVVRILTNSGRLQPVPRETIESIRLALTSNRPYYPDSCLKKGERVRVAEGPLAGVVGIIAEAKDQKRKVIIEVELFRRAMAVEIEDEAVEPWH